MAFTWSAREAGWEVVVEDDDRVCYAYLLEDGRICSDVWLGNRVAAPEQPEWKLPDARDRMPFLNPVGLAADAAPSDLLSSADLRVDWTEIAESRVRLLLEDRVVAVLEAGARPGWSAGALRDGPVARRLDPDAGHG